MPKWIVAVTEEHVFYVTVEAENWVGAVHAATEARKNGKGRKMTKEPRRTAPWAGRMDR